VFLRSVLQLLITADIVPNSLILSTLMMEAILSSEKSVLTRATRRHIQEDGILLAMLSQLNFSPKYSTCSCPLSQKQMTSLGKYVIRTDQISYMNGASLNVIEFISFSDIFPFRINGSQINCMNIK
jgi:hypothetical protein